MRKILVIHGPNLNLLGKRKPKTYGNLTFEEINKKIEDFARVNNIEVEIIQSNQEGDLIDAIHNAKDICGIVINPAGYTHYSVAIRDTIEAIKMPAIEVHVSNIYAREEFRQKSVIAPVCTGQITGLGYMGYLLAIEYLMKSGEQV
jgi:3-dehydroquinate dehydratase-2